MSLVGRESTQGELSSARVPSAAVGDRRRPALRTGVGGSKLDPLVMEDASGFPLVELACGVRKCDRAVVEHSSSPRTGGSVPLPVLP
jgi:hypothetical protein